MINPLLSIARGIFKIRGATDFTLIGNVEDALKVVPSQSKKVRYVDMNVASGGVARASTITSGAAATTVFSYSGSGLMFGFILNLESSSSNSDNWLILLQIDGDDVFTSAGLNSTDLISTTVYDLASAGTREPDTLGLEFNGTSLHFIPHLAIPYSSSVVIKVQKTTGGNKKFNAGLINLSKET